MTHARRSDGRAPSSARAMMPQRAAAHGGGEVGYLPLPVVPTFMNGIGAPA
jgi:hypothetical protein